MSDDERKIKKHTWSFTVRIAGIISNTNALSLFLMYLKGEFKESVFVVIDDIFNKKNYKMSCQNYQSTWTIRYVLLIPKLTLKGLFLAQTINLKASYIIYFIVLYSCCDILKIGVKGWPYDQ